MGSGTGLLRTADFVVLGAGINGASIAFHLAHRGARSVVVLDKGHAGDGGTGRSSALVRMHYTLADEVRLAVSSLEYFRNWQEIVGRPAAFHTTGFLRLVPASDVENMKKNVAMHRELGADARLLTAAEVKLLEPEWVVDDFEIAAYEPGSGYGDAAVAANDLLERARELGATYLPRTRVHAIRVEAGRVRGVTTDAGAIDAPVVVAAVGPWSRPLLRTAGVDLPIEPEFHRVGILENPPGVRGSGVACIDSILNLYYRPEGRGRTLVGEFYGPRDVDPDDFPQSVPDEALAEMASGVARRIPRMEDAGVVRGVTGIYDMSPDQRPLLGPVPGVEGLHCAAGFSGMGFKIAPAVGLGMAELILDGHGTEVDLTVFDPGRFAAGRPIKAPHEYADE